MAIKITTTKKTAEFIRLLVYGKSGVGKTRLIASAPKPVVISSEKKALSLRKYDIEMWQVKTVLDIEEARQKFINSDYQTCCIDSITDIAEMILYELKKTTSDGRQAYGKLYDIISSIIRDFRDIPNKNIYMIAKAVRQEDVYSGIVAWVPSMPGKALVRDIPYFFDLCFMMRDGETKGVKYKYLQTEPDIQHQAKGDSSTLQPMEEADLTKIFNKILERK